MLFLVDNAIGENPFQCIIKNGIPVWLKTRKPAIDILPEVEQYLPTPEGAPPLGNATILGLGYCSRRKGSCPQYAKLTTPLIFPLELNTMPGWAGSSWYFQPLYGC